MFEFIKYQWELGNYDEQRIARCVSKGFITQAQADDIMTIARG